MSHMVVQLPFLSIEARSIWRDAIELIALSAGSALMLYALSYLLKDCVTRMVRGRMTFLLLIFSPGVVVHELAHLLACFLIGVEVTKVSLFHPRTDEEGHVVLGYVEHEQVGSLRTAVIGLAPLLFSGAFIYMLIIVLFGYRFMVDLSAGVFVLIRQFASQLWQLTISLDYSSWRTWLFIYLVATIALGTGPSDVDIRGSIHGALVLLALLMSVLGILYVAPTTRDHGFIQFMISVFLAGGKTLVLSVLLWLPIMVALLLVIGPLAFIKQRMRWRCG